MKERLGRIFIIAGIIFLLWPDVMSQTSLTRYQEQLQEYWPIFFVVIGFFFMNAKSRRKSHR